MAVIVFLLPNIRTPGRLARGCRDNDRSGRGASVGLKLCSAGAGANIRNSADTPPLRDRMPDWRVSLFLYPIRVAYDRSGLTATTALLGQAAVGPPCALARQRSWPP